MKLTVVSLFITLFILVCCGDKTMQATSANENETGQTEIKDSIPEEIKIREVVIEKDLLYDKHTLEDTYPYKDTVRVFQWDKIRNFLILVDSIQEKPATWGILQNRKNKNGEAPLTSPFHRDTYKLVVDTFGTARYEGIPLFDVSDSITPVRYALDGTLVKVKRDSTKFINSSTVYFEGNWIIPSKYIKFIEDTVVFKKVICVDRKNQNAATLEKVGSKWLIRSMNPVTTGLHRPPVMKETPLGIFVIQEKKRKMIYLTDDQKDYGGFAPYASRFCNGGYLHGVPVNSPRTTEVEFSSTLGTTPRSHMCVRNATSHAQFIYNWAPVSESLVFVLE